MRTGPPPAFAGVLVPRIAAACFAPGSFAAGAGLTGAPGLPEVLVAAGAGRSGRAAAGGPAACGVAGAAGNGPGVGGGDAAASLGGDAGRGIGRSGGARSFSTGGPPGVSLLGETIWPGTGRPPG